MNPPIITFNYGLYISNPQFALYSDAAEYPAVLLQKYWDIALNYISNVGNFGCIQGSQREYAIQLMMSHIIFLTNLVNTGDGFGTGTDGTPGTTPYQMQNATVDKVSVSVTPPPNPDQFQWWLGTTPFGQQLLAMLQIATVGGQYLGGSYVRAAFQGANNAVFPWIQ